MILISILALIAWTYLVAAHGHFWRSTPQLPPRQPSASPAVDILVPARDEAESIAPVMASLRAQRYTGPLRIVLIDDNSTDGTAERAGRADPLEIITGSAKPPGWSGKLWALHQGVAASRAPLLLLTDADIVHEPEHLASLVAQLEDLDADLVSEMVALRCSSLSERALIPAFVYFFQMLYPFQYVNDPRSRVAAAAGGTILIRRYALERIGGIEAIRGALIDDVALARAVKRGGRIYLGHSGLARSIRPYPHLQDVWRMIARTAFTQLEYSWLLLLATVLGLLLLWWVPVLSLAVGQGWVRIAGIASAALAVASYQPTLHRYRCSPFWALALPLIALFYLAATVGSAIDHLLGRGARWKSRAY
jgi:hopene-associated glycosyltransferase HpnB